MAVKSTVANTAEERSVYIRPRQIVGYAWNKNADNDRKRHVAQNWMTPSIRACKVCTVRSVNKKKHTSFNVITASRFLTLLQGPRSQDEIGKGHEDKINLFHWVSLFWFNFDNNRKSFLEKVGCCQWNNNRNCFSTEISVFRHVVRWYPKPSIVYTSSKFYFLDQIWPQLNKLTC